MGAFESALANAQQWVSTNNALFNGVAPENIIAHLGVVNPPLWQQLNSAYSAAKAGNDGPSTTAQAAGTATAVGLAPFTAGISLVGIPGLFPGGDSPPTLNEWAKQNAGVGQQLIVPQNTAPVSDSLAAENTAKAAVKTPEQIAKEKADADQAAAISQQQQLAQSQLGQSNSLFQQAMQALQAPLSTFNGAFTQDALTNVQGQIGKQGEAALSTVKADAAKRGIAGSTIEGSNVAATQGNIAEALANQTFQFLLQSGQQGEQNRQFLAQSLFSAAQSYLGAGTQSNATGIQQQGQIADSALRQQTLAEQIRQFNEQQGENSRQFNLGLSAQNANQADNMNLLMRQLSMGQNKNIAGSAISGLGAGAMSGLALAPFTGGVSLPVTLGLSLLGGAGGGLGEAFR